MSNSIKKWMFIFSILLWYVFVDNTPWIQEADKKIIWLLKPGWSTEKDCWDIKVKLFERYDGNNKLYMCIDMGSQKSPVRGIPIEELTDRLRKEITQLILQLRLQNK